MKGSSFDFVLGEDEGVMIVFVEKSWRKYEKGRMSLESGGSLEWTNEALNNYRKRGINMMISFPKFLPFRRNQVRILSVSLSL